MSLVRFTRRRALVALALLPAAETFAAVQPPTAGDKPEPPAPQTVKAAIAEAEKLRGEKKFAEAIAVLEARQKELGTPILPSEKRALILDIAYMHFFWANEAKKDYKNQEAIQHYQDAYTIFKTYDPKGAAGILNSISLVYKSVGETNKAIELLSQVLPIYQQLGDKSGEARLLNNLGSAHSSFGDKSKALFFFNQALLIRQQIIDKKGEATTFNNMGSVYDTLGDKSKAMECFNKALLIQQQVGDNSGKAGTLNNIGGLYSSLGAKIKALKFYNEALLTQQQNVDKTGQATTLNNIGLIYSDLGEKTKALEFYNESLLLKQEVQNKRGEATTLNNIGSVYKSVGETTKAIDFFNQALPLYQRVGDKSGEATTLNNIGSAYSALGKTTEASGFFGQALPIMQQVGDKAGEANTAHNLMVLFYGANPPIKNVALSVNFGKQSVNLYQYIRANIQTFGKDLQASFIKSVETTYRVLADILIAQGRLPEALQVLGLLKDQEFAELFRGADTSGGKNAKPDLAALTPREAAAQKRYDTAGKKITDLAAEFATTRRAYALEPTDAAKARLADLSRAQEAAQSDFSQVLAAITAEFQAATPSDALDKLKTLPESQAFADTLTTLRKQTAQNTVAVYTLVAPERLHCIVITPSTLAVRTTAIKVTDLNQLVKDFRVALENPKIDPRPQGKKLYDLLVKPIEADLKAVNAQSVLWSLDGTLRYVPLAALSPDGKTYMAQQTRHSSLFAPAALPGLVQAAKSKWNAAAFGVTTGRKENGVDFPDLPGAFAEIVALDKTIPTRAFVDSDFTEAALRNALAAHPPVVHIASHFALKPNNPSGSFLLLGKGSLRLEAIAQSRSRFFGGVELLTLSACNTASGGGTNENGVEVESFALLAQKKGAGAVLASLWPVDDSSTQALMQTFYDIHKAKPTLGKAECLREAQVALITGKVKPTLRRRGAVLPAAPAPAASAKWTRFASDPKAPCAHPFYWAAFTLAGNTK